MDKQLEIMKTNGVGAAPDGVLPGSLPPVGDDWNGAYCRTIVITPQYANELLSKNVRNRRVRKSHVTRLARDMQSGRWQFNPQPISIGTDGTILDGQHRLSAIVKSGASVRVVLWFDVPLGSREVIDQGIPRKLHDVEDGMSSQMAALVRATMIGGRMNPFVPTIGELIAFRRRHLAAIEFADSLKSSKAGLRSAPTWACVARASMGHVDRERLIQFALVLDSGVTHAPEDETVIKLRDRLVSIKGRAGATHQSETYFLTARSLVAFNERKVLSKLFLATSDPFPLPNADEQGE